MARVPPAAPAHRMHCDASSGVWACVYVRVVAAVRLQCRMIAPHNAGIKFDGRRVRDCPSPSPPPHPGACRCAALSIRRNRFRLHIRCGARRIRAPRQSPAAGASRAHSLPTAERSVDQCCHPSILTAAGGGGRARQRRCTLRRVPRVDAPRSQRRCGVPGLCCATACRSQTTY